MQHRWVRGVLVLGFVLGIACVGAWLNRHETLQNYAKGPDAVVLYEGLPHQFYERDLLEQERRAKPTQELNDYLFYKEPLGLNEGDAQKLSAVLSDPSSLQLFEGEKKCGGFHPDYAIELHRASTYFRVLICFGCGEAKVFGSNPRISSRHDLSPDARQSLYRILEGYRKNRPPKQAEP